MDKPAAQVSSVDLFVASLLAPFNERRYYLHLLRELGQRWPLGLVGHACAYDLTFHGFLVRKRFACNCAAHQTTVEQKGFPVGATHRTW